MRIIPLQEIRASLDLQTAIDAVRDGFIAYSAGGVQLGAVGHLTFPETKGDCHIKSATMRGSDVFAVKIATGFPRNTELGLRTSDGMMVVLDARTGGPLALLHDEGHLTDLRTAIAGGLAAALIKPDDCSAIGIVGTGIQARLQAELAARLTSVERIVVWGRDRAKASNLATELNQNGMHASPVDSIAELTRLTRLVITTTPSRTPLVARSNSRGGMRIVAVGADAPGKQEIETALVASMDLLVADSKAQCIDHGELGWGVRSGMLEESRIVELGALLAQPRAIAPDASVLVDLTGIGIQDLQIAAAVWTSVRGNSAT